MSRSSSYFFSEARDVRPIDISIEKKGNIDFSTIDERIVDPGGWESTSPSRGGITVPTYCAQELLDKLRLHPKIMSIDGVLTKHGEELRLERMAEFQRIQQYLVPCRDLSEVDNKNSQTTPKM